MASPATATMRRSAEPFLPYFARHHLSVHEPKGFSSSRWRETMNQRYLGRGLPHQHHPVYCLPYARR